VKVFVHDVSICNGCHNCQIACKDEHVGNDWTPYAKPQPDTGQFWLKLNEFIKGTIPKVKMHYLPVLCMHCAQAPCMTACPVEEAMYRREDGLVIIDPTRCTGCQNCVDGCPYGVIFFNEGLNLAQKCTGCAHLLDDGWKEPRCVDVCPTGALRFLDEAELKGIPDGRETLHPEYGTEPRVYYLNLPGQFIAGTVYEPVGKDIVEGAACTLTAIASGESRTVETNGWGDFWFKNLGVEQFSLRIEAEGFEPLVYESIDTREDVNLGDIALKRS
jgi:Fe-S-cluster-containing dehydrogenase component